MAVDEERLRHSLQSHLAELVGAEETALLMSYLPPVGWADVATKRDLDVLRSEMAALRSDLRAEIKSQTARILLWLMPMIIAGMAISAQVG